MNIALFLSSDGIALAHRQTAGHWAMVGETALDVPDLSAALAELRGIAVDRAGEDFEALLVLPDDQILYTSLTVPTADSELAAFRIEESLDGLTPYAVTELEYDWRVLEEDRVKIAVVARETLDEARGFASQYGFEGKGFVAMPPMERFPGVPAFDLGDTVDEMGFTAEGIAFGPDTHGMPDSEPEVEPEAEVEVAPDAPLISEDTVEPEAEEVAPEPQPEAPAPEAPVEDVEPDLPEADDTSDEPEDQNPALAEALLAAAAAAEAEADEADEAGDNVAAPAETAAAPDPVAAPSASAPVQAIDDPSLSGPITPIAAGDEHPDTPVEVVGDAGENDDLLPPRPSPASLEARERARVIRGETPAPTSTVAAAPAPPAPTSDSATFSARRGHAAAPDTGRDSLVGQRSSRIGLTHPDGPPRAAPSTATTDAPPATPEGAPATPMPRLAKQLERVRNASKKRPQPPLSAPDQTPPRPRVEIEPQPPLGTTGVAAERRPSPFETPPQSVPKPEDRKGILGGLRRNRGTEPEAPAAAPIPTPAPDATPDASKVAEPKAARGGFLRSRSAKATAPNNADGAAKEDGVFSTGLLARKTVAPTGGSFKTGLVLTLILLLLLAMVAIWSAVFLPNSPVARLLGFGDPVEIAATPSGLQAPDVTTTSPEFGTSGAAQPSLEDEAAADGMDLVDGEPVPDGSDVALIVEPDNGTLDIAGAITTPDGAEALPDIDADLDLPPLPPIDQGQNPTPEEAEALYAEDGIWARSPDRPDLRPFDLLDRVYTASIDPEVSAFDAVALPDPGVNPGELLRRFPPPPAFGTAFDLTASGLVAPTPEGVLTPEGAFVVQGAPPFEISARPRPREVASAAPVIDVEDAVLGTFRPAERPGDLSETRERQILNGLTESELGERRPTSRPTSPQEAAAQASLFPADGDGDGDAGADGDAVEAAVAEALAGTDLAVARSLMPRTRPGNIAQIVASADRTPAEPVTAVAVAADAVAAGPAIPSNADVSRAATERNAIRLRNVNLIGVSGTPSERRALVRLSSGRFVRVGVGDRLDGGRVAAIGETTLQYVRSGRTVTLEIPG